MKTMDFNKLTKKNKREAGGVAILFLLVNWWRRELRYANHRKLQWTNIKARNLTNKRPATIVSSLRSAMTRVIN
jgi:hypothetical protein